SGEVELLPPQAARAGTAVAARPAASRVRRFRLCMVISSEDCASLTRPTLRSERRWTAGPGLVTHMVRTNMTECQALSEIRSIVAGGPSAEQGALLCVRSWRTAVHAERCRGVLTRHRVEPWCGAMRAAALREVR